MKSSSLRRCLGVAVLCLCLQAPTNGWAQHTYASAPASNSSQERSPARMISLKSAVDYLYRKFHIRMVHDERFTQPVVVPEQLLQQEKRQVIPYMQKVLEPWKLGIRHISGDQYSIGPVEASPSAKPATKAQVAKMIIAGKVRDKLGQAIIGVTVRVAHTATGTVTNEQGFYSVEAEPTDTLEFSFIGYISQRIPARNRSDLDVTLEAKEGGLNEVVVVGFGAQKKVSLVGAQSTIKAAELKLPARSLTNALAGRLAGVVSVQKSGEPGYDVADVYIRGVSTFSSSPTKPLVVVDGVPDRNMNDIDPEDIENFTILKDASATAVYGTRGANGVIIINTKQGKAGRPNVNLELSHAFTKFTKLPDFVDAPTFMRMYNEGLAMRGNTPIYTEETIQKHVTGEDPDLYPNVDWYEQVFNKWGNNKKALLNVRGGSEFATYYLSAGYYNEVGMLKRDKVQSYNSTLKLDRFNFTSNLDMNVTKTTKVEFGVNGYIINGNYPGIGTGALFDAASRVPPHIIPPMYSNGLAPEIPNGGFRSPYMQLTTSGYATEYRNDIRSNIRLRQNLDFLTKGLSFSTMFAFDAYSWNNLNRKRDLPTYFTTERNADGTLKMVQRSNGSYVLGFEASRGGNRRFYTETSMQYARTFGKHDVSAMVLYNQSDYVNGDASELIKSIPFRLRGLSGRATYGFDSRYYSEVNFGYNGSENFSPKRRYGFFPSFGAGWVVSNEGFFEDFKSSISLLKFRYTIGVAGNSNLMDDASRFLFRTTIKTKDVSGYQFGVPGNTVSYSGIEEGQVGSDVSWETGKRQNLGIELKTFSDKVFLQVDLFKERRSNILLRDRVVPYASGYTPDNLPFNNVGIVDNKGVDLTLEFNHQFNKHYAVNFRGNFTYTTNENVYDALPPWQYPWLNRTGHPVSQRWGYQALGLFSDSAEITRAPKQAGDVRPGDIKYADLNGDGIINSFDQTAIGYGSVPRIMYGLNLAVTIRRFDIYMFWQGAGLVDFSIAAQHGTNPFYEGNSIGNLYSFVLDRWTPDNPNPRPLYPRLSTREVNTTNYVTSDWWVKRSDYIRLKELMIGYNFGVKRLTGLGVKSMRAYLQTSNLLTFSRWKEWDPELTEGRGARYPPLSVFNLGLRVNFL